MIYSGQHRTGMENEMPCNAALADSGDLAEPFRNVAGLPEGSRTAADGPARSGSGEDHSRTVDDLPDTASAVSGITYAPFPVPRPRILLGGEKDLMSLLKYIIDSNGFDCILTDNCADAIALAETEQPALIALDDTLCDESAAAAREKLYQNPKTRHIPALIMAGDPVHSEDFAACPDGTEYVMKPVLPEVFIGRLHDLMRASSGLSAKVLRFADIVMDPEAHRVYRGGRCVRLGPVEYRILQHLLEYPRKVFSREQILASIRTHSDYNAARSIDVQISRIRKALCEHGEPNYIRTVRGLGYSLDVAPDGPAAYVPRPILIQHTRKPPRSDAVVTASR
jgi:two-component system, OmpR family, phosphate regulon response regulator PhoB